MTALEGKTILVTGGGGFIGSTLVRQLIEQQPEAVRVFDNDQQRLFQLMQCFDRQREDLRCVLGDLRDRDRVRMVMKGVDTVFHVGAVKHVELSEYNPNEAIQTNIYGTQNVVRAAATEGIESFTAISTDKASNPASVMGATKFIMERLVIAANNTDRCHTDFNCVRFGNVLGSTGSVVPIFLKQIRNGGPITVTDPDMTRFIMSVDRAVELVLTAHSHMTKGEVVVLKMPAFRVGDLAHGLRAKYSARDGHAPEEINIDIIGKRPGERVHEKLISYDEVENTQEFDNMFVIHPEIEIGHDRAIVEGCSIGVEYTSADAELLSPDEIVTMVENTTIHAQVMEE